MKKLLLLATLATLCLFSYGQSKGYLKYDSLYVQKDGGTSELILKNRTQDSVGGFLVNKGGGRTEFKRALKYVNDSTYLIGSDTLKIKKISSKAGNGVKLSGDTLKLGNSLTENTKISGANTYQIHFDSLTTFRTSTVDYNLLATGEIFLNGNYVEMFGGTDFNMGATNNLNINSANVLNTFSANETNILSFGDIAANAQANLLLKGETNVTVESSVGDVNINSSESNIILNAWKHIKGIASDSTVFLTPKYVHRYVDGNNKFNKTQGLFYVDPHYYYENTEVERIDVAGNKVKYGLRSINEDDDESEFYIEAKQGDKESSKRLQARSLIDIVSDVNTGAFSYKEQNESHIYSQVTSGSSVKAILTISKDSIGLGGLVPLRLNGDAGTAGQVIMSAGIGSAPYWGTVSGGSGTDSTIYGYNGTLRDNRTMNGNRKDLYLGSGVDSMSNLHSASINTNHGFSINDGDGGTIATTGKNWALTAIGHVQFSGVDSLSFNGAKIRFNNKIFMPAVRTPWDTLATLNDVRISAGIGWGLTGNSGTTAGTNFIGTTDNVDLVFKRNGVESGRIGESNTSLGEGALAVNAGDDNVGIGDGALGSNVGGYSNTAIGKNASASIVGGASNTAIGEAAGFLNISGLSNVAIGSGGLYNATGSFSTALGSSSLYQTTTGTNNIGLGYSAGKYNSTLSNRLFLNSLDRSNLVGDTTLSIIYGYQAPHISNQKIRVNGHLQINDSTQAAGKVFTSDANGVGSWQTPSGGGSGTVNSGTQYRLAHYATTGTAISEAAAITGDRLLISDANGVPTHSAVTATEAGYLTGISSSVQTQLTARLLISDTATMLANANVLHKTGTETVYGAKTFISNITATGGVALGAGSLTLTNGTIMNYPSWTALSIYGYTTGSGVWIGSTQSNQGFANISSTGLQYGFSSVVNGTFGNNAVYIGGTGSANASALLHLNSTTKGFLPPVMTRTQADAIASKAFGLKVITSNDSSELVWMGKWMYVAKSGYYTPTLTNTANIDASTAYACVYSVSGDVVTVSGTVDIDPSTASTATELRMSLPITTTFTNTLQGNGTASPTAIQASWGIESVNGASTVAFKCSANDISNNTYKFIFTYKLQ